jgi:hypothetical protein
LIDGSRETQPAWEDLRGLRKTLWVAEEVGQGLGRSEVLQWEVPEESWKEGDEIMKLFVAIFGSLFLLAVAAFCVFGFLATFEPTDNTAQFMTFRVGYAVIGLGCLVGVGFLIVNEVRKYGEWFQWTRTNGDGGYWRFQSYFCWLR